MMIYLIRFILLFALTKFVLTAISNSKVASENCLQPNLSARLLRMVEYNEPDAFEIILHSECRNQYDPGHQSYLELFEKLLQLSLSSKDQIDPFLVSLLKKRGYTPQMLNIWHSFRPLLPISILRIFHNYFRNPDSSVIYGISFLYPQTSPERNFLIEWLLKIQGPALHWPFKSNDQIKSVDVNSKTNEDQTYPLSIIESSPVKSHVTELSDSSLSKIKDFRFGHMFGWVSRKSNPFVQNSKDLFRKRNQSVLLRDTFLAFSSSQFDLENYALAHQGRKSFFSKHNSALTQRIRSKCGFSACRTVPNSDRLEVILSGEFNLVVLERLENDQYDFKYPLDPYQNLRKGPTSFRSFSVPIKPSDIVLLLPRSLFTIPDNSIFPHDLAGSFHYTDLKNFAAAFVNFINYVHLRTNHFGLVAVGGFIY